jgi:hypothetical protein
LICDLAREVAHPSYQCAGGAEAGCEFTHGRSYALRLLLEGEYFSLPSAYLPRKFVGISMVSRSRNSLDCQPSSQFPKIRLSGVGDSLGIGERTFIECQA